MEKKSAVILYTIIIVALVALIVFTHNDSPPSGTSTTPPAAIPPTNNQSLTAADLSQHSSQEDCWIGFQGKAYDITSWLPRHPGSAAAIAPYCGTSDEFESAFEGQHGSSQIGRLMKEGIYKGDLQ